MSMHTHVGSGAVDGPESRWSKARTLNSHAARLYSEWTLLVQDLEYALKRAHLWKKLVTAESEGDTGAQVSVSVFRDAVISFVSCFDRQQPAYLDPAVVFGQLDGATEYYAWLEDMRNTWVAHRSGPYRQCVAAIVIDEETGNFHGLGHLAHLYIGPKPDAADDLIKVMETALNFSRGEQKRHENNLRNEVAKMNPLKRISLPLARTVIPGSPDIRMGRRKFQNIKRTAERKSRP